MHYLYSLVILPLLFLGAQTSQYSDYFNYAPSDSSVGETSYAKLSIPNKDGLGWYVNAPKKAQYCEATASLRCVKIGTLTIALPASGISLGNAWTMGEREFQVVSKDQISLMGNQISVFTIEARQKNETYRYLFNSDLGVVAIIWPSHVKDTSGDIYLLGTPRGLFAPVEKANDR